MLESFQSCFELSTHFLCIRGWFAGKTSQTKGRSRNGPLQLACVTHSLVTHRYLEDSTTKKREKKETVFQSKLLYTGRYVAGAFVDRKKKKQNKEKQLFV